MSFHKAKLSWQRTTADFVYETYDRTHAIELESGTHFSASAAADFFGNASLVNPEELLVSALASCHLLTFLAVAAKSRLEVNSYADNATGTLEKNSDGKLAVTHILLRPHIVWNNAAPSEPKIRELHEKAHRNCLIGNSIRCDVIIEPIF